MREQTLRRPGSQETGEQGESRESFYLPSSVADDQPFLASSPDPTPDTNNECAALGPYLDTPLPPRRPQTHLPILEHGPLMMRALGALGTHRTHHRHRHRRRSPPIRRRDIHPPITLERHLLALLPSDLFDVLPQLLEDDTSSARDQLLCDIGAEELAVGNRVDDARESGEDGGGAGERGDGAGEGESGGMRVVRGGKAGDGAAGAVAKCVRVRVHLDELRLAADGDGAAALEDTEHASFAARRPARLPAFQGPYELSCSCVAFADLDANRALANGVVEGGGGDGGGDAGGEADADQAGGGEDEGGVGRGGIVKLAKASLEVATLREKGDKISRGDVFKVNGRKDARRRRT